MGNHDECCAEDDGQEVTVTCNCGWSVTRATRSDALAAHEGHFNIETIRAERGLGSGGRGSA